MYDKHSNKSEIVGKKECMSDLDDTMISKEEKVDFNNYSGDHISFLRRQNSILLMQASINAKALVRINILA